MPSLRIVFFGTPDFAVPSLRALAESAHAVVGVVSQPDRPRGRGRSAQPTPVKVEAERHGIPVLQPEKLDAAALEWLREREPDLGVVVAFGQFIPKRVRELPPHRLINAHASLLPRHRGAAPIPYAILSGETQTGISVMRVEKEMDAGDVCAVRTLEIGRDETAGELEVRLADLAAEALSEAVDAVAGGTAQFQAQEHGEATLAPKLDKEFAKIDWNQPRDTVLCRIRAATPRPGVDLGLRQSGRTVRILAVTAAEGPAGAPGRVVSSEGRLRVAALDGWIEVLTLQAPGKRPIRSAEFLRGARVPEDEEAETA